MELLFIVVVFVVVFGHYALFCKEQTGEWPSFEFFFRE